MESFTVLLQIILLTVFTVVGDIFLKKANNHELRFINQDFLFGLIIYAVTAFIWVIIYKSSKFSISGLVYSMVSILSFVMAGVFVFGEKLSIIEYLGALMGLVSVVILARFL